MVLWDVLRAREFLTTLMPDGSPPTTQTWVDTVGEHVVINEETPCFLWRSAMPPNPRATSPFVGTSRTSSPKVGREHIGQDPLHGPVVEDRRCL
jgi:hypothetical protein